MRSLLKKSLGISWSFLGLMLANLCILTMGDSQDPKRYEEVEKWCPLKASGEVGWVCAENLLNAAIDESEKLNVKMNIAIMDNGSNMVGFLRMDEAWLGSVDIAMKKAKTAVFFQMDTEKIGELSQPGGSLFNIEHSNQGLITFPGGVPLITKDGKQAGGIGVSGSTVDNDKAVAKAVAALFKNKT